MVGSSKHARPYSRFCEYVEQRPVAADMAGIGNTNGTQASIASAKAMVKAIGSDKLSK